MNDPLLQQVKPVLHLWTINLLTSTVLLVTWLWLCWVERFSSGHALLLCGLTPLWLYSGYNFIVMHTLYRAVRDHWEV